MMDLLIDLGIVSAITLRKLVLLFLSHWMGYDHGDSYFFNSDPNGIPFSSKSKRKLSPRPYTIQCERKWNTSFLSVLYVILDFFCSEYWHPPWNPFMAMLKWIRNSLWASTITIFFWWNVRRVSSSDWCCLRIRSY